MENQMRPECSDKFKSIEDRLDKGDDAFKEHGEKIVKVETDVSHLTKSLDGVTKALWGVAASIGLTLFGFFIWYVQNIKK